MRFKHSSNSSKGGVFQRCQYFLSCTEPLLDRIVWWLPLWIACLWICGDLMHVYSDTLRIISIVLAMMAAMVAAMLPRRYTLWTVCAVITLTQLLW